MYEVDIDDFVHVYTDGACFSNGRNGARAGFGVFWGDGHPLNTSKPVYGRATNNRAEILAATTAMKQALDNGIIKLAINTFNVSNQRSNKMDARLETTRLEASIGRASKK